MTWSMNCSREGSDIRGIIASWGGNRYVEQERRVGAGSQKPEAGINAFFLLAPGFWLPAPVPTTFISCPNHYAPASLAPVGPADSMRRDTRKREDSRSLRLPI